MKNGSQTPVSSKAFIHFFFGGQGERLFEGGGGGGGALNINACFELQVRIFYCLERTRNCSRLWRTVPKHQLIQKLLFYCTVYISDVLPEVRFRTVVTVLRGILQGDSCLDLFSTKWGWALKRERALNRGGGGGGRLFQITCWRGALNRGRALIRGNTVYKVSFSHSFLREWDLRRPSSVCPKIRNFGGICIINLFRCDLMSSRSGAWSKLWYFWCLTMWTLFCESTLRAACSGWKQY